MKKKYKYILFTWCVSLSVIMGIMVTFGFVKCPDSKYEIAVVVYIIYVIIMTIGVRRISVKSRYDNSRDNELGQ